MENKILEKAETRIVIEILDFLDGWYIERLEDDIKKVLWKYRLRAKMKSSTTGNEMTVG